MSCNGCFISFSLIRPEKGCSSCGYSYCSKCLCYKIYIPRLKAEHKVCNKCKVSMNSNSKKKNEYAPPDVFFKRTDKYDSTANEIGQSNPIDEQMRKRLNKLKESDADQASMDINQVTDSEIADRLQKIKGEMPITSDTELHARLARLRGIPVIESKPVLLTKDLRTEQEQVEDLMKQYLENTAIDCKYKDEFDSVINVMEVRLQKLKAANAPQEASGSQMVAQSAPAPEMHSDDEEESVEKIIEKLKVEAFKEKEEIAPSTNDELPFCEICTEDANMRCLGCRYLFCKPCFLDHKDDDDACNAYELYQPPKGTN